MFSIGISFKLFQDEASISNSVFYLPFCYNISLYLSLKKAI